MLGTSYITKQEILGVGLEYCNTVLDLNITTKKKIHTMLVLYSGLYIPLATWSRPQAPAVPVSISCRTSSTVAHRRRVTLLAT